MQSSHTYIKLSKILFISLISGNKSSLPPHFIFLAKIKSYNLSEPFRKELAIQGTYQCYLKSTYKRIRIEILKKDLLQLPLNIKLVRGAYMVEELKLSSENNTEYPIWDDINQTHECYNSSMSLCIDNLQETSSILIATHNADSIEIAIQQLKEIQLGTREWSRNTTLLPHNPVSFGQLYGLGDHLTAIALSEGYKV